MEHEHDSPLQIDARWDGAAATVTVAGDLDITTAATLTRRLLVVAAGRPVRLVLDLRGLAFVDVAGARELDDVHTLLQTVCPVILRRPRPPARKVFGITGLMELADVRTRSRNDPSLAGYASPLREDCHECPRPVG